MIRIARAFVIIGSVLPLAACGSHEAVGTEAAAVTTFGYTCATGISSVGAVSLEAAITGTAPATTYVGDHVDMSAADLKLTVPAAAATRLAAVGGTLSGTMTTFDVSATNAAVADVNGASTPIAIGPTNVTAAKAFTLSIPAGTVTVGPWTAGTAGEMTFTPSSVVMSVTVGDAATTWTCTPSSKPTIATTTVGASVCEVSCSGICIDPTESNEHCGATAGCGLNGQGSAGVACTAEQSCIAGVCQTACIPRTCADLDTTCGGPISDGCGGMLDCNDGVMDGSETDVDCGGVAATGSTCDVACAQGKKCKVGTDCLTGFCADGVCCDTACTGLTCQACSAAAKGQGVDGVCGPVGAGDDPHGDCSVQPASTCGQSGGCNGAGACNTWPNGTICAEQTCSAGTVTSAQTCVDGACTAPTPASVSCSPYAICSGSMTCATTCNQDSDCVSGDQCTGANGTCQP